MADEAGIPPLRKHNVSPEPPEARLTDTHTPLTEPKSEAISSTVSGESEFQQDPAVSINLQPSPPTPPPPPRSSDKNSDNKESIKTHALNLKWALGLNPELPVLSLSTTGTSMVVYATSHTAILYDSKNHIQQLLQGHRNTLTCLCVSLDKRWVVTADSGYDSLITVWDSYTGVPVKTLFDPHGGVGVASIALSQDSKYLASLSASIPQSIAIWDWSTEDNVPSSLLELDTSYGHQSFMLFHPLDNFQLLTNSDRHVVFYTWSPGSDLQHDCSELTDKEFNKPIGKYSQSVFQPESNLALTATSLGNLVIWSGTPGSLDWKPTKLVSLQKSSITVLTMYGSYIVTGDSEGKVKFYDGQHKLLNWYQDLNIGPIAGISFSGVGFTRAERDEEEGKNSGEFKDNPFIVTSSSAAVAIVNGDSSQVEVVCKEWTSLVQAIHAHPAKSQICIGTKSGHLKLWDYETQQVVVERHFEPRANITALAFDHCGQYMAVGFHNGKLSILDAVTLIDERPEQFHYSKAAISQCCFSPKSDYLATVDEDRCVTLFRATLETKGESWAYVGRQRAHYKRVCQIMFGVKPDSKFPRLISLGEDRVLVEYDLEKSTENDLHLQSSERLEQTAVPTCMAWYPSLTSEDFILTANNQFKMKLYNTTTKMCRKTVLGPSYGTPLQCLRIIHRQGNSRQKKKFYAAHRTADKVGLLKLPLDGNPHNSLAVIGHPGDVVDICCSHDGKYMFTGGATDATVFMWEMNFDVLEAASHLGGLGIVPFYDLLEGGQSGTLFREMENFFYYAQIRSQGLRTMDVHRVASTMKVEQIPYVMRALGYYPTQREIDDMMNEVKYSDYVKTGEYKTDINLEDFIRLFVNHRPAVSTTQQDILDAFCTLGGSTELARGDLLEQLQTRGEHMSELELLDALAALTGQSYTDEIASDDEDAAAAAAVATSSSSSQWIEDCLPEVITPQVFTDELLGFGF